MLFVYGLLAGAVSGGFLAYMFADSIVTKTVAEFKKLEGGVRAEVSQLTGAAGSFVSDVKKDL